MRKAVHKATGIVRACKIIYKDATDAEDRKKLLNEVEIMKNIDHPNILRIFEVFEDDQFFYLITEMCTGGELFS